MPIAKPDDWRKCVDANQDPYGKCCVDVAREVMRILDEQPGPFHPFKLVCDADDKIKAGGITGFMAGCVASMVSQVHSRGEEFRKLWNVEHAIGNEAEKLNAKPGAIINPAILTIGPGDGPAARP